jgi:hypothetical protein
MVIRLIIHQRKAYNLRSSVIVPLEVDVVPARHRNATTEAKRGETRRRAARMTGIGSM